MELINEVYNSLDEEDKQIFLVGIINKSNFLDIDIKNSINNFFVVNNPKIINKLNIEISFDKSNLNSSSNISDTNENEPTSDSDSDNSSESSDDSREYNEHIDLSDEEDGSPDFVENFLGKMDKLWNYNDMIINKEYNSSMQKNYIEDKMEQITNILVDMSTSEEINKVYDEGNTLIFYFSEYFVEEITKNKIFERQLNDIFRTIVNNPIFDIEICNLNNQDIIDYVYDNKNYYFINKLKRVKRYKNMFEEELNSKS